MDRKDIIIRVSDFIENVARSCSMDFGCITPEYVYKMWGGFISIEEIENGFKELLYTGRNRNAYRCEASDSLSVFE